MRNRYASREIVALLKEEHGSLPRGVSAELTGARRIGLKRRLKCHVYARLPKGLRVLEYVLYRYVARLGLLDGRAVAGFHVLQGFWFRYSLDNKLHVVHLHIRRTGHGTINAIRYTLGIDPLH